MDRKATLKEIDEKIQQVKEITESLTKIGEDYPSLYRNSRRALASIKMLELNFSDIKDIAC